MPDIGVTETHEKHVRVSLSEAEVEDILLDWVRSRQPVDKSWIEKDIETYVQDRAGGRTTIKITYQQEN